MSDQRESDVCAVSSIAKKIAKKAVLGAEIGGISTGVATAGAMLVQGAVIGAVTGTALGTIGAIGDCRNSEVAPQQSKIKPSTLNATM